MKSYIGLYLFNLLGVESCKIVLLGAFPIHLFKHFCCKIYRLATRHSVTDIQAGRQTDRRQYHAKSRSYRMQYDWLKLFYAYDSSDYCEQRPNHTSYGQMHCNSADSPTPILDIITKEKFGYVVKLVIAED